MASPIILTQGQLHVDPSCKVLKAKDYALYMDAQSIIAEAKKQAESIGQQAQEDYQKEKAKGYEDGVDQSKIDQADQILKVVSRTINYLASIEKVMAELLMSSIRKIIGEFDQDKLAISLVKNALQHVRNEKQVTIRVPATQYGMVKERLNDILASYKGVGFIDLISDPRLSTGDCIMESEIGVIEASIDVQLAALQKRFEQANAEMISGIGREAETSV
ncbi:Yop proteins translocation protein L [invertebrate metagenome]|uniref:Yop proteins translocation protein L n=1 Tax=invertebrate metagenome TaxID=1711999 RepID=A0A2H9T962_9ZZZZ